MAQRDKVTLPLEGGCQCGKLRYRLKLAPLMLYACHCTNCQKQTGSAFVLSMAVPEAALEFIAGLPSRFEWTSDAGNQRYGLFCTDCGGRIANGQTPSSDVLSLRAGTLDDRSWLQPAAHIWTRSAQQWFPFRSDDLLFEKQPENYAALAERFQNMVSFQ